MLIFAFNNAFNNHNSHSEFANVLFFASAQKIVITLQSSIKYLNQACRTKHYVAQLLHSTLQLLFLFLKSYWNC